MKLRSITEAQVMAVCQNPDNVIARSDLKVYQSISKVEDKSYLFRIFVNDAVDPNLIVTVYRTSKINKYYEGEI